MGQGLAPSCGVGRRLHEADCPGRIGPANQSQFQNGLILRPGLPGASPSPPARSLGGRIAAEHGGQLVDAIAIVQRSDRGPGAAPLRLLADDPLAAGVAGDLGQVGDANDLVVLGQLGQRLAERRA